MSKILFIVNHDVVIYNFRLEIVERLLQEGHEIVISSPYGERIDDLIEIGCKYIETSFERRGINLKKDLKLLYTYIKMIDAIKPDIVLTFTVKPNIYGGLACALTRTPYITNITGLGTAIENGGLLRHIMLLLYRVGIRKSSCVLFQNSANQKTLKAACPGLRCDRLIPGSGVNLQRYAYTEYPGPDEPLRLLFMSRIMRDKGIFEFLEAAEAVKKIHPMVQFEVIGMIDDNLKDQMAAAQSNGTITYHGFVRETRPYIARCAVTILPSYHEGTANVLLESAATGRPVIASLVPGCQETFDEGLTGFGVVVRNSGDLARAINRFIELPHAEKARMGKNGRTKMEREYDRSIVVEAYLEEIQKVFGEDELKCHCMKSSLQGKKSYL